MRFYVVTVVAQNAARDAQHRGDERKRDPRPTVAKKLSTGHRMTGQHVTVFSNRKAAEAARSAAPAGSVVRLRRWKA